VRFTVCVFFGLCRLKSQNCNAVVKDTFFCMPVIRPDMANHFQLKHVAYILF
jgi:hypothetical protein